MVSHYNKFLKIDKRENLLLFLQNASTKHAFVVFVPRYCFPNTPFENTTDKNHRRERKRRNTR